MSIRSYREGDRGEISTKEESKGERPGYRGRGGDCGENRHPSSDRFCRDGVAIGPRASQATQGATSGPKTKAGTRQPDPNSASPYDNARS